MIRRDATCDLRRPAGTRGRRTRPAGGLEGDDARERPIVEAERFEPTERGGAQPARLDRRRGRRRVRKTARERRSGAQRLLHAPAHDRRRVLVAEALDPDPGRVAAADVVLEGADERRRLPRASAELARQIRDADPPDHVHAGHVLVERREVVYLRPVGLTLQVRAPRRPVRARRPASGAPAYAPGPARRTRAGLARCDRQARRRSPAHRRSVLALRRSRSRTPPESRGSRGARSGLARRRLSRHRSAATVAPRPPRAARQQGSAVGRLEPQRECRSETTLIA